MIMSWPSHPLIYEINTWTWLRELSRKYNRDVSLANVPAAEYDKLQKMGCDAIWLMGVWERSPAGIALARQHSGIMGDLRKTLPDFADHDLAGSPYCIRRYRVESTLGGQEGLKIARKELARRGMKLILDFVPNHLAPDHPWTDEHPEYFINGTAEDLAMRPDDYLESNNHIFARARDPFYPPWPDVVQLNLFHPGLRLALTETIAEIAGLCDGVRCDMAMLVLNDIFSKTWPDQAGEKPAGEIWQTLIPAAKKINPSFLLIGEVYWDMEWEMMQLGFDFCYDKRLYDRLLGGEAESVRQHLSAELSFQGRLLRFLENHDEARAATLQPTDRHMALAVASLTLPGARLIHQGQIEGCTVRIPVFLGRAPREEINQDLLRFYTKLLGCLKTDTVRNGVWGQCDIFGWPENPSYLNLLAWEWAHGPERILVIVNLSDQPAQGRIRPCHGYPAGRTFQLFDVISGELYHRDSDEMNDPGLFAGLQPWGIHVLSMEV